MKPKKQTTPCTRLKCVRIGWLEAHVDMEISVSLHTDKKRLCKKTQLSTDINKRSAFSSF